MVLTQTVPTQAVPTQAVPTQATPSHRAVSVALPSALGSLVLVVVLALPLLGACSGARDSGDDPALGFIGVDTADDGHQVEKLDVNGDKRADVWRHYRVAAPEHEGDRVQRVLYRKDIDLNFDGRVDMSLFVEPDGAIRKEEFDLDFDGRVDMVTEYEGGAVQRQMMDENFDGAVNVWRYFENGAMVRKERDSDGDGRVDLWEYFENGKLIRIGRDIDRDGRPEHFEEMGEEATP